MAKAPRRFKRISRDSFLFAFGTLGIAYEAAFAHPPSEALIFFFGGLMLGIPFLRAGDKKQDKKEPGGDPGEADK